jgi:hypothetical protein
MDRDLGFGKWTQRAQHLALLIADRIRLEFRRRLHRG